MTDDLHHTVLLIYLQNN